jgi:hypothetical protein
MVVYKQYLRSPEWRRKRVAVILRAKGRCERCGLWPVVFIHHLSYTNLGNEPLSDLLGVCPECHKELHL